MPEITPCHRLFRPRCIVRCSRVTDFVRETRRDIFRGFFDTTFDTRGDFRGGRRKLKRKRPREYSRGQYTGRLHVWETKGQRPRRSGLSGRKSGGKPAVTRERNISACSLRCYCEIPVAAMPIAHVPITVMRRARKAGRPRPGGRPVLAGKRLIRPWRRGGSAGNPGTPPPAWNSAVPRDRRNRHRPSVP